MKKILSSILSLGLMATILSSCSSTPDNPTDKPIVYTTFYTMYDLASKVGGDKIQLENLIPAGDGAHSWEPSTGDIIKLEKADLLIYSGAGFEGWVDKITQSLSNKELIKLEASNGIDLLETNSHHHDDDEHHHDYDPHVWTSVKNAKKQMENIKEQLIKVDPENKEYYQENFDKYEVEFDNLHSEFEEAEKTFSSREIVVGHESFAYLCRDYNLTQLGIDGLAAHSEPDAERMKQVIDFAKENNVTTIFFEETANPKVAETVAKEVGAELAVLNPCESLTQEQIDNGEDYLSVMKANLVALKKALS